MKKKQKNILTWIIWKFWSPVALRSSCKQRKYWMITWMTRRHLEDFFRFLDTPNVRKLLPLVKSLLPVSIHALLFFTVHRLCHTVFGNTVVHCRISWTLALTSTSAVNLEVPHCSLNSAEPPIKAIYRNIETVNIIQTTHYGKTKLPYEKLPN